MATVVFAAVGTLLGGPLGTALGAMAGQRLDQIVLNAGHREGPRLTELAVSTSSYGTPLPRVFGRMRVPGTIIWSTDLVEHSDRQGGKGRPSTTTYSYTASLAVALSARPIIGVERIWADGNLLRGAAGDMKAGGSLRVYTGHADQPADPLIAAAEGPDQCPAFRGLAYAVLENIDLSPFGNRIPALSFEVIADEGPLLIEALIDEEAAPISGGVPLTGVEGLARDGSTADLLRMLDPVAPVDCSADGDALRVTPAWAERTAVPLPDPAAFVDVDAPDGGRRRSGYRFARRDSARVVTGGLRYYDIDRDFQPGLQVAPARTRGAKAPAVTATVDLPAAMTAASAAGMIAQASARAWAESETLVWHACELDPAIAPGSIVTLSGMSGRFRVTTWEWSRDGVTLDLVRAPVRANADTRPVDPGRALLAGDEVAGPSLLAAFELPWDGNGSPDGIILCAAVAGGSGGAALYADTGDGQLHPLGSSGAVRSTLGRTLVAPGPASPLLLDRTSRLVVHLATPGMALASATLAELATGANRALVGEELLQFGQAMRLPNGDWELSQLLRGRGGTEHAVASHIPDETFVLLDGQAALLDATLVGDTPSTRIAAIGRGDGMPVMAAIEGRGRARQPLTPVRARADEGQDGSLTLSWLRRGRGQWAWRDGLDAALVEQTEAWRVDFRAGEVALASWETGESRLAVTPAEMAQLRAAGDGGHFCIRQVGTHAISLPALAFL